MTDSNAYRYKLGRICGACPRHILDTNINGFCRNCRTGTRSSKWLPEENAVSVMMAAGLKPLVTYPGAGLAWKCECVVCGLICFPRYANIVTGQGGCKWCGTEKRSMKHRTKATHVFQHGRSYSDGGYVILSGHKGHPNAWEQGYMFEHVLVMATHLGRPLVKPETVHHKNGIKDDNDIDNLELWSSAHPPGQRVDDKVDWAIELLRLYKPEALNMKQRKACPISQTS